MWSVLVTHSIYENNKKNNSYQAGLISPALLQEHMLLILWNHFLSPYTPNFLFVGQRQTMQTQIRRHNQSPLFAYRMYYEKFE